MGNEYDDSIVVTGPRRANPRAVRDCATPSHIRIEKVQPTFQVVRTLGWVLWDRPFLGHFSFALHVEQVEVEVRASLVSLRDLV